MEEIFNDDFLEVYPSDLFEIIRASITNEYETTGHCLVNIILNITEDKYAILKELKEGLTHNELADTLNNIQLKLENEITDDGWMIFSDHYKIIFGLSITTKRR